MNETTIEKIAQYLDGELSPEDRLSFESEIKENKALEEMVTLYSTIEKEMRQQEAYGVDEAVLKNTLTALNAKYFLSETSQPAIKEIAPVKKLSFKKWLPHAVAASVIIIAAMYFLTRQSPHQSAENYITENISELRHTMAGTTTDTLQAGITAYNDKSYGKAKMLFSSYSQTHPESIDAKKYTGFVYLTTAQYDSALLIFDQLTNMQGLYSNPGIFLKAVTLLKRDGTGDKPEAKRLLQMVVTQHLEGSEEAEKWLKQF